MKRNFSNGKGAAAIEQRDPAEAVKMTQGQVAIMDTLLAVKKDLTDKLNEAHARVEEYAAQCIRQAGLNPEKYLLDWDKKEFHPRH